MLLLILFYLPLHLFKDIGKQSNILNTNKTKNIMTFEDLKIIPPLLQALEEKNYKEPTAIQQKAIPVVLTKGNILGSATDGNR